MDQTNDKKLTVSQKITIAITIIYEIFILAAVSSTSDGFSLAGFLFLSFPVILYYIGVWIFGFGYLLKLLKKGDSLMFGTGIVDFYSPNQKPINRLQYFGGIVIINVITYCLSYLSINSVFLLCIIQYVFCFFVFILAEKRSLDFNKNGLNYIFFLGFGIVSRDILQGFPVIQDKPIGIIFAVIALLGAAANLVLLFTKGTKHKKIKTPELLKRKWLLPLIFLGIEFITSLILGDFIR